MSTGPATWIALFATVSTASATMSTASATTLTASVTPFASASSGMFTTALSAASDI